MKLHELTDIVTDKMLFEFDQNKKIGHIRCQYGWENQIANQFVPAENMSEKIKNHNIDIKRINEVCDCFQFEFIDDFERLTMYCKGIEEKIETNYFFQDNNINYWVRLNPNIGTSEYNCYIHIFHS